ncbi:MAG: hypothetical protein KF712_00040 [Akkermansiaceae bacterium]|nr:hypothetical protein [Akkermansiaceae bacterium]
MLHPWWVLAFMIAALVIFQIVGAIRMAGETEDFKTVYDGPPDEARIAQMESAGFPKIHRVVENSLSFGMTGDGHKLLVYVFDPGDWEKVRDSIGKNREWKNGVISEDRRGELKHHGCPDDLLPRIGASDEDILISNIFGAYDWMMIDRRRGICYSLRIST